jgi:integrase
VAQLLDAWFEFAERDLAVTTRCDYRSVIAVHLKPGLGQVKFWQLRAVNLDRFYRTMAAEVGPARVVKAHNVMRSALGQAVRWEWVATNVALSVTPPRITEREIPPPQVSHVKRSLDMAEQQDPDLTTFVRMAAATGARRGELVALRWSDLDLEQGMVAISTALADGGPGVGVVVKDTKAHATRRIAIDQATVGVLRDHRRPARERAMAVGVRIREGGYVFARDFAGEVPWRPDTATHRFTTIRARGPAERGAPARPAALRNHRAARRRREPEDRGRPARHKRVATMLDRYSHFVPARDREAADRLGRLLGG